VANPTLSEVINRSKSDIKANIEEYDPSIKNNFLTGLVIANSGRFKEFYGQLDLLKLKLLLQTSSDDFLDSWGSIWRVVRQAGSQASGNIIVTGSNGISIPSGTNFLNGLGSIYSSTAISTIASSTRVANISVSGLVATATLTENHNLGSGVSININGASNPIISGDFDISVTGEKTFTFTLTSSISDGDYGNANILLSYAVVSIESEEFTEDTNLSDGNSLTLENSINSVNDTAYTQYGGIVNGSSVENDEDYRNRVLFRTRNPIAFFSPSYIKNTLLETSSITRVWVLKATPAAGYVTIYFVKDNDATSIIPTSQDLIDAKNTLVIPASLPDQNVIVNAPSELVIDFNFNTITTQSVSMQESIKSNLTQFFKENLTLGSELPTPNTITVNQYTRAILSAVNQDTGESLSDFTLNSPTGDIAVASNQIPVLGSVTF